MDRKRKKRKFGYSSKRKKSNFVHTELKGFLCTCAGNERECIKEALNILSHFADIHYGEEPILKKAEMNTPSLLPKEEPFPSSANSDIFFRKPAAVCKVDIVKNDIGEMFGDELTSFKPENAKRTPKRFTSFSTKVTNTVFIATTLDPFDLGLFVMTQLKSKKQNARYLMRLLPAQIVCKVNQKCIEEAGQALVNEYFNTDAVTYSLIVKVRSTHLGVDRNILIENFVSWVRKCNEDHSVNLTNSEMTIFVNIVQDVCCLSVVKDYFKYHKYNIQYFNLPKGKKMPEISGSPSATEYSSSDEEFEN